MPVYRVSSHLLEHPDKIQSEWLDLQDRSECSYFQSWGWIGSWLDQIAIDLQPLLIKVCSGSRLIGMGLFVSRDIRRHHIIRSRSMFLNEYPFEGRNMVIEYNGLLAERGYEEAVYAETVNYLLSEYGEYDEFHFGAIADGWNLDKLAASSKSRVNFLANEVSIAWHINLTTFSAGLDAYLATLSRNRRGQIRRCLRLYEQQEPLGLVEALNTEEALEFLDELKVLHTDRHASKGQRGAFANPLWEKFHRALILARFDKGEIQLLKIGNSSSTVGYLYNFLWRKRVYVQQTGFKIAEDKRFMPGYVAHTLAILHNKEKGMAVYDLMHGDSLYKRLLCNRSQELYWVVLQRNRLKFVAEVKALDLVRWLRG